MEHFIAAGGNISQAKKYNNAVRPCILAIPIENAIIPALHLDLGIFTWLFEAMLKELQQLDMLLASKGGSTIGDSGMFSKLAQLHADLSAINRQVSESAQQRSQLQNHLQYVTLHAQQQSEEALEFLARELQSVLITTTDELKRQTAQQVQIQAEIEKLSGRKDFQGPCAESLDPVLQANKIQRQVYHGGAFNGNHIHIALRPTVVTAITDAPKAVVSARCPALKPEADKISLRYKKLMTGYAKCRAIFSKCSSVDDDQLKILEDAINTFLQHCREEIVSRGLGHVTPKLHLLEDHILPMMKRLRVGVGLLGEQGAESIHSAFNNYESDFKNISSDTPRLKAVTDQHVLSCVMELRKLSPQSQKRKAERQ